MLSSKEDVVITSLKKRGWSISAIARHTGRDGKTIRACLSGEREPGVRAKAVPDGFDRYGLYVRQRFFDDPHVWAAGRARPTGRRASQRWSAATG